jgi:hypothetical protein
MGPFEAPRCGSIAGGPMGSWWVAAIALVWLGASAAPASAQSTSSPAPLASPVNPCARGPSSLECKVCQAESRSDCGKPLANTAAAACPKSALDIRSKLDSLDKSVQAADQLHEQARSFRSTTLREGFDCRKSVEDIRRHMSNLDSINLDPMLKEAEAILSCADARLKDLRRRVESDRSTHLTIDDIIATTSLYGGDIPRLIEAIKATSNVIPGLKRDLGRYKDDCD